MDGLKALLELDFTAFILAVFVVMSGVISVYTIIGKFSEVIGKPVKWVRQRQVDHDLLEKNKKDIKDLSEKHEADTKKYEASHQELIDDVRKLTNMFLDKQISDYRWEIINLADEILNGKTVSRECLKHAISIHSKYEAIIVENGLINGEVDLSMKIINKTYLDLMEDEG